MSKYLFIPNKDTRKMSSEQVNNEQVFDFREDVAKKVSSKKNLKFENAKTITMMLYNLNVLYNLTVQDNEKRFSPSFDLSYCCSLETQVYVKHGGVIEKEMQLLFLSEIYIF